MLPTLNGRIQSRIVITLIIGGLWSLLIALFLPGLPDGFTYKFRIESLWSLLVVFVAIGIAWEILYHGLMQFRWEKDWPTLFGLLTIINEGIVLYLVAHHFPKGDQSKEPSWFHLLSYIPKSTFLFAFITTWLVVWLWANGPMRIFTVHWRFRGGRFV